METFKYMLFVVFWEKPFQDSSVYILRVSLKYMVCHSHLMKDKIMLSMVKERNAPRSGLGVLDLNSLALLPRGLEHCLLSNAEFSSWKYGRIHPS